jgi:catechol 2,3-dioxygenase-like lactoylglutathione lyase family enzyme
VSATKSRLSTINLIVVASTDQDRSIEFYEQILGFEKRTDIPFGNQYRWVEVYPPSGTTGIALAPPQNESQVGVQTGISLTTDDIDATHEYLRSQGVDVDEQVSRMGGPVPPLVWFRDPDGNSLMIVEQG